MKPLPIALACLACLALPCAAAAQEPPAWTVQVDPLTTALGFAHVQIERAVSPHASVYVGPHLRLFNNLLDDKDEDYTGYGVEVGLRWFFAPEAPQGWWVGVRGVAAYLQGPTEDVPGGYVSALGGYTWIHDGWLVLAGGLGVQYLHYTVEGLGPKGVLPAAHTALGVAF
jgi:hypothetical protein